MNLLKLQTRPSSVTTLRIAVPYFQCQPGQRQGSTIVQLRLMNTVIFTFEVIPFKAF